MQLGFFSAIFLVLLILKLTGDIAISWFIVFLPLFIPFILFVTFIIFAMMIAVIQILLE